MSRRRAVPRLAIAAAFVLLAGVVLAAYLVSQEEGEGPAEVEVTERDNGSTVALSRDDSLVVALVSNPSTGFSWHVKDGSDAGLILVDGPRYVPPGSTGPVVGAAGTEVFTFEASKTGTTELVLEYRRVFEPTVPAAQTFRITVTVE